MRFAAELQAALGRRVTVLTVEASTSSHHPFSQTSGRRSEIKEIDHLLGGALALMSLSLLFRKARPAIPASRLAFYASGATTGIMLGGITMLLWHFAGRDLDQFGLRQWLGNPSTTAVVATQWLLIVLAWLALVREDAFGEWLRRIYSKYDNLMPRSRRELLGSWATSVAAGSGEEIVYRRFLLWYGTALLGLPLALLGTSILFGVAHGYQSRFGVLFATAAGLILGVVFLATSSMLLVMWMHATYNIASFTSGKWILGRAARR
jgi:membrane protease YdiL (CAAX protease family)